MTSKANMTGMLGVYLTAVELVKRGFITSPTSRSAAGADLLVTDQRCQRAWSVQVKTNSASASFWLVGLSAKEIRSESHIYVFVNANKCLKAPQFYVVPSVIVADRVRTTPPRSTGSVWRAYYRDEEYQENWSLFGDPMGIAPQQRKARGPDPSLDVP